MTKFILLLCITFSQFAVSSDNYFYRIPVDFEVIQKLHLTKYDNAKISHIEGFWAQSRDEYGQRASAYISVFLEPEDYYRGLCQFVLEEGYLQPYSDSDYQDFYPKRTLMIYPSGDSCNRIIKQDFVAVDRNIENREDISLIIDNMDLLSFRHDIELPLYSINALYRTPVVIGNESASIVEGYYILTFGRPFINERKIIVTRKGFNLESKLFTTANRDHYTHTF
tara:strand:- start:46 stop:717 length:672 start_codon:yes stop_codon:yes gene_type:complete